ncbi:unnamed protein product [Cuscuta europaea]|uniref:Short-chain dehydrogenase TIC 32, chloroplastic n=1 Tax=Cuscuta europaea TaxID=41803 RepID=A0A9P0ZT63_CUSEU|nr:unnamed protein product [Cuscuta europaea]
MLRSISGIAGASGFGSASTAAQVSEGIDASNLTAIVTGGGSGIGLETARVLALRKAHVIIAARNTEGAVAAAREVILRENPEARVDVMKLDLSSLKSVKAFAEEFNALSLPLNILINNAGVMFCPFQLSEDGYEMQFATNHLGHFHLTNLLLDNMKAAAKASGIQGRIVNLSSIAHRYPCRKGIKFDHINDKKSYNDKMAYGRSKLANILHANHLSRRLRAGRGSKYNCEFGAPRVDNDKSYEAFNHPYECFKDFHFCDLEECPSGGSYNLLCGSSSQCERRIRKVLR